MTVHELIDRARNYVPTDADIAERSAAVNAFIDELAAKDRAKVPSQALLDRPFSSL